MTAPEGADERHVLEDFLAGRLPDADAERVADRLAGDPRLRAVADELPAADPLVEAVRDTARLGPPEDTPPLRELMTRLERLAPAPALAATRQGAGDTPAPAGPATGPGGLAFLRPAQEPGELGRLADFRVLEVLGEGGMGLVLRAEDVRLRRQVALKVIRPERAADPAHRERFLREARAAARLHHDHVMPVHQVGEDNGVLFLAMPLLAGQTLEDRLARQPPLTVGEQLRIGREIALGLAAAHERGLIHRDVKPSNVWLEARAPLAPGGGAPEGEGVRVKVLDFGLARFAEGEDMVTPAGAVVGTPAYMAPEQADGQPLDGRSDLFGVGCILYLMATGRQPFTRGSLTATLRAVADHTPPPPRKLVPEVPPTLSDLIVRLLAKSPADRPESAAAVAAALGAIGSGGDATATFRPPAPPPGRGRPLRMAVATALLAVLLVGAGALFLKWPGPSRWNESPAGGTQPEEPARPVPDEAYQGYVDVLVWTKAGGAARHMRLSDDGALPLHVGDQVRVEAKVTPEAYLYLFWIDTEGQVAPVYPWDARKGWGSRPAKESPHGELGLPENVVKGYTINGDKEGMETLLLLARPSPLPADDNEVRGWFEGIKPQRPVQNPLSAVWFENGKVVQDDARRKRQWFEESDIDDPVLRMQELLRGKLQGHAAFTTAVSFARQGK
jgi:tRNA A-37 threonylcarbamoyl transferase component Bud32